MILRQSITKKLVKAVLPIVVHLISANWYLSIEGGWLELLVERHKWILWIGGVDRSIRETIDNSPMAQVGLREGLRVPSQRTMTVAACSILLLLLLLLLPPPPRLLMRT
jgi:hypothetical protein